MASSHNRAARREREAAKILGTERVRYRPRFVSAPDTQPVRLANGTILQPEVKDRKRLPKLITKALEQASRYRPGAIPLAILSERGGPPIVCLSLAAFAELLGIAPPRSWVQLSLYPSE
jgi:hypothetical protein